MPRPESTILRERLKQFIQRKGLTITGWCKRAGITEATLRGFLNGRSQTLTHATLAALATAAGEPIAALLKGRSAWGETEMVELTLRIDATERKEGDIHLPEDEQYSLRVPCFAACVEKFAALVSDESANEIWPKDSILICRDFEWEGPGRSAKISDFIVLKEERNEYDQISGVMVSYHRCTVRELVEVEGAQYLLLRSDDPRFRDSARLPGPITDMALGDVIVTGLGMTLRPLGKVLASITSHTPRRNP